MSPWDFNTTAGLIRGCAWDYPEPWPGFELLTGHLAFHPAKLACYLGDERASPQLGGYYGGWITEAITGPYKGAPGTEDW